MMNWFAGNWMFCLHVTLIRLRWRRDKQTGSRQPIKKDGEDLQAEGPAHLPCASAGFSHALHSMDSQDLFTGRGRLATQRSR